ncbi:reverse transcriptase (RNA-dependent DNA polymerase) [Providencia alcalifaciens]|uniref:Reverse transcriptase (RNA-dependent DNA polymerase) n=1 Tax=Providencia alcalifaciens TaxID=126385 RepID=A0A4R3NEH9_9GAMM|nr:MULTISPECIES: reverse transcriptase domain-containing protein [Providencia]TCT28192.1 reverse transcriptase (RNA-dependent DNA polymerase) [Providencia alcalifaciens]
MRLSQTDPDWAIAYQWLCRQRRHAPANADIWDLRWRGERERERLYQCVIAGEYRLSPMLVVGLERQRNAMWSARDALVLKWVSLRIQSELPLHDRCFHVRGKGVRTSLSQVAMALQTEQFQFVHRTDIRGYYGHIRKVQVMQLIRRYVMEPVCVNLIHQYVDYCVEEGGEIVTPRQGIARGCALSPLIGASLLYSVDNYYGSLNSKDVFYARYMDDFLLLTRTRWQLRRGIGQLADFFNLSGFERHPDKTQTGRIEKGFDWLGIWFGAEGPTVSSRALNNHRERRVRLFEQARNSGLSKREAEYRVQAYAARWKRWADGMLLSARIDRGDTKAMGSDTIVVNSSSPNFDQKIKNYAKNVNLHNPLIIRNSLLSGRLAPRCR